MVTVDLKFSITPQQLDLDLEKFQPITEQITELVNDHAQLINRDLPDQHPMEAITGLPGSIGGINDSIGGLNESIDTITKELGGKVTGESITNSEIAQVWNSVMGM